MTLSGGSSGYSASWLHHKGRNRHHFEYWTDYSIRGEGIIGVEMPEKYVAEMFCDRLAASQVYRGKDFQLANPYHFFQRSMQKRLLIAPRDCSAAGNHASQAPGRG